MAAMIRTHPTTPAVVRCSPRKAAAMRTAVTGSISVATTAAELEVRRKPANIREFVATTPTANNPTKSQALAPAVSRGWPRSPTTTMQGTSTTVATFMIPVVIVTASSR
jgi:hypothetical protein